MVVATNYYIRAVAIFSLVLLHNIEWGKGVGGGKR